MSGYNSRGGGRGGGRHHGRGGGGGGRGGNASNYPQAMLKPCSNWTTSGNCPRGNRCGFAHVLHLHATIQASSMVKPPSDGDHHKYHQQNNQYHSNNHKQVPAAISSVTLWETPSHLKIFSGSHDGYWRLWGDSSNTTGRSSQRKFVKEFEHCVGTKVECVKVASNFLFCGLEASTPTMPHVTVGMIHAWNLAQPTNPPLEFQIQPPFLPYAHSAGVTALQVVDQQVMSGSKYGDIRIWTFDEKAARFVLSSTLVGHARQITGLVVLKEHNILWSSSTDGSLRIWDLKTGQCQFFIAPSNSSSTPPAAGAAGTPPQPTGHANAVTSLQAFSSPGMGSFVLSASLDGFVKVWNATNGECVKSESHGEGVVCMALTSMSPNAAANSATSQPPPPPQQQHPLLLIGLERGNIMVRNVIQTPKIPAFSLLMNLANKFGGAGHEGSVRALVGGPSNTFYSGGEDGNILVFQINGDLGL